jgi:hypothetical protein
MEKYAVSALVAAGMDRGYADLIRQDSPIRIWRLTNSERVTMAAGARQVRAPQVTAYQLEVPLVSGPAWSSEISEEQAQMVKAALDRAGIGYLTEF